jgi:hypothetical protein
MFQNQYRQPYRKFNIKKCYYIFYVALYRQTKILTLTRKDGSLCLTKGSAGNFAGFDGMGDGWEKLV